MYNDKRRLSRQDKSEEELLVYRIKERDANRRYRDRKKSEFLEMKREYRFYDLMIGLLMCDTAIISIVQTS